MPIQRIPLTQPIETRDGTLAQDSKSVNGYFESREGKREFVKRPGLLRLPVTPSLPVDRAQGMTIYNGNVYLVINNVLYKIDPYTFAVTTIGSLSGTIKTCYFTPTLNSQFLFLHNQTNGYLVDTSNNMAQITNDRVASVTILAGGSGYVSPTVVFSDPPAGAGHRTATGTVQMTGGVITGVTIVDAGAGYVTAPSATIIGYPGTGALTQTLLNFFPTGGLTPGCAFIDGYIAVLTPDGRIYSSSAGDPTVWNALDYIQSSNEPDTSTGLVKHINYLLDFGQYATDFYYDAGNTVGSPFSVAPSYHIEIGCANGNSIVSFEQTTMWIGTSKTLGQAVYILDGVSPVKISTNYIDRTINNSTLNEVTAYAFKFNGHTFYLLTLHDTNVTIVYDLNEKVWYQWTMWARNDSTGLYGEQYFRPSYFAGVNNTYFVVDHDNGNLYSLSDIHYTDANAPIYYRVVTDIVDNGTTKRKFYNRLEIVGDKVAAVMQIRHTGDDYKTWSNYRTVDLNKSRSQLYQSGADRRRAWEFLCIDAVPLRLDCAELDFSIGELENDGGQSQSPHYRK